MRWKLWRRRLAPLLLSSLALLSFCRGAGAASPGISFTVHHLREANAEGPDVARTYFLAKGRRIVFAKPPGCHFGRDEGGLVILLTESDLDGEIHVGESPFTPETDLAANALQYREAASKSMPRGAERVEVQPPLLNPYPYNGWKSLGFTWSYTSAGRGMVRTTSYINLEIGLQIVVTTLAARADAEKVAKIAQQFMSSWWVMEE